MAETALCITVDWSCMGDEFPGDLDPEQVVKAELFAQAAIKVLTGRRVGACPVTVRPCVASCAPGSDFQLGVPWMIPFIQDGRWYNSCGCKPRGCSCTSLTRVYLDGPVGDILSVTVDGEVLDASDYFVANFNQLVRVNGPEWPKCQNLALEDTEPGTMSVEYLRGAPLDALGEMVAGLLAKEYLEACLTGECALPHGITSLARQGVQIEFGPELFPGGRTGIDAVDLWVASWNPYNVKSPSRIYSPDVERPMQATWRA